MLLDHLNNHSSIYGFAGETRILPYILANICRYGDLDVDTNWRNVWDSMRQAFPFWKANARAAVPLPTDWLERQREPSVIFDYLMSYFAERENKSIWCEKTPMHALHIETLARAFPSARFIHCIRDGRDSAASFHRRYGFDPKCTIFRWKKTIRAARDQGSRHSDRYFEIKYEDATLEPVRVLTDICRSLGLDFEENVVTSSRQGSRFKGLNSDTMVPNPRRFQSYFGQDEITELEEIGGSMLHELGYSVSNSKGDKALSTTHVWLKDFTVRARLGLKEIPSRIKSAKQHRLRFLFGRYLSSWQQSRTNKY